MHRTLVCQRCSLRGLLASLLLPLWFRVLPVGCSRLEPVISRQNTDGWSLLETLGVAWKEHSTLWLLNKSLSY